MGAGAIRELTREELHKKLDDTRRELFTLRLKVGPQRNTGRIRELRREVAQMMTVLQEKGIRA